MGLQTIIYTANTVTRGRKPQALPAPAWSYDAVLFQPSGLSADASLFLAIECRLLDRNAISTSRQILSKPSLRNCKSPYTIEYIVRNRKLGMTSIALHCMCCQNMTKRILSYMFRQILREVLKVNKGTICTFVRMCIKFCFIVNRFRT